MEKFETKTPPNMIEFRHTNLANEWVMRITADRRIEVNEGVEVNDAAKKVLEAMQHMLTPQRKPLTDEMVLAGARALAKRHADSCGLDFDDVWKYYAEEHKIDAKAVIEAAHGIKD